MSTYNTVLVDEAWFSRGTRRLGEDDIIIAFIGQTGSGKSQIIDTLTGQPGRRAAESYTSVTQDLTAIRILEHERWQSRIVLIDTPGFDDSSRTDAEILRLIGVWLKKTYKKQILLSGIVYVQRITDPRMGTTPHRNLRMFAELTGPRSAKNVVLATTMWDILESMGDVGNRREQRLKEEYWNVMIHHGATVQRFLNDSASAWNIINIFLNGNENNRKTGVIFQEERVVQKKRLEETSAAEALTLDLDKLVKKQIETMRRPTRQSSSSTSMTRGGQETLFLSRLMRYFSGR